MKTTQTGSLFVVSSPKRQTFEITMGSSLRVKKRVVLSCTPPSSISRGDIIKLQIEFGALPHALIKIQIFPGGIFLWQHPSLGRMQIDGDYHPVPRLGEEETADEVRERMGKFFRWS